MQVHRPFGSVAEHSLGKGEVPGPIPGMGTINLVLLDVEVYCIGSGLGLMLFFLI